MHTSAALLRGWRPPSITLQPQCIAKGGGVGGGGDGAGGETGDGGIGGGDGGVGGDGGWYATVTEVGIAAARLLAQPAPAAPTAQLTAITAVVDTTVEMAVLRSMPGHAAAMAAPGLPDDPSADARFAMKLVEKSDTSPEPIVIVSGVQPDNCRRGALSSSSSRRPVGGGGEGIDVGGAGAAAVSAPAGAFAAIAACAVGGAKTETATAVTGVPETPA